MKIESSFSKFLFLVLAATIELFVISVSGTGSPCKTGKSGSKSNCESVPVRHSNAVRDKIHQTRFFGLTGLFGPENFDDRKPSIKVGDTQQQQHAPEILSRHRRHLEQFGSSWPVLLPPFKKGLGRTLNIPVQVSTGVRRQFQFGKKSVPGVYGPMYNRIFNIKKRSIDEAEDASDLDSKLPYDIMYKKEDSSPDSSLDGGSDSDVEATDGNRLSDESVDTEKRRFNFGKKWVESGNLEEKRKFMLGKKSLTWDESHMGSLPAELEEEERKRKFNFGKKSVDKTDSSIGKRRFKLGKKSDFGVHQESQVEDDGPSEDKRKFNFGKKSSSYSEDQLEEKRKFHFGKKSSA